MAEGKWNVLNRMFTRNTFQQLLIKENATTYNSAIEKYVKDAEIKKNAQIISEIYKCLKTGYRNEYYYKNTIMNRLLLGKHSIKTTTALTEIPIANSKADFVLINGKAVVYEIKTELDNFDRLETQVNDYYKAFDHVVVVTCMSNVEDLKNKLINIGCSTVGIYVLQDNGSFKHIREPERNSNYLDYTTIFKMLRKSEYENIIRKEYGFLPNVSQFDFYSTCKKMFGKIDIKLAYNDTLWELKKRNKVIDEEFIKVPYELKFIVYFSQMRKEEYLQLDEFLQKQYGGV